jgi:hypothetical protein
VEQRSLVAADNGYGNRPLAASEDSGQRLGKPILSLPTGLTFSGCESLTPCSVMTSQGNWCQESVPRGTAVSCDG